MATIFNKVLAASLIVASMPTLQAISKEEKLTEKRLTKRLFNAIKNGHVKGVRKTITNGVDVNAKDNESRTPLIKAIYAGRKNIVKYLIKHGAHVNNVQERGWAWDGQQYVHDKVYGFTPLGLAAHQGHIGIVKLLIEAGANPNEEFYAGYTALHAALNLRNKKTVIKKIIEYLITHGADINAKDKKGSTVFTYAYYWNEKELCDLLRKHGAKKIIASKL